MKEGRYYVHLLLN